MRLPSSDVPKPFEPVPPRPSNGDRVHTIRMRVTEEERALLVTDARREGTNMSETIRRAIREYLGRRA